ncbi:hypothetical protein [Candidatus Nitrospira neomarina]|uniref:Uncharacterized protein n=1 Tax=Candidatus Nitrospira neomarina TaxID=3020899 RepID=A0AA96JWV1_9BACT|nr:hypothetical protein [Candidatus Nitrospira neomarina]WNM62430.1 hypothetical protein PQG83_01415 [Candidatus Nitrospira neomarina]
MADDQQQRDRLLTLGFVGPIKRSTFQLHVPDLEAEALNDVFHWSSATRFQADRLRNDVAEELATLGRKRRHAARRMFTLTSTDEHLFLVAGANLRRVLIKVPRHLRKRLCVTKDFYRVVVLLRNIYEHWNELRPHIRAGTNDSKGTIAKLRKEFPAAEPWSFTIDRDQNEIILANVVNLRSFTHDLRRLESRVLRIERSRGRASTTMTSQKPF